MPQRLPAGGDGTGFVFVAAAVDDDAVEHDPAGFVTHRGNPDDV
jgi:hypothetical protein